MAGVLWLLAAALTAPTPSNDAAVIERNERARLRALVDNDRQAMERLHDPTFAVVNPLGRRLDRAAYLGSVASGVSDYHLWQADQITIEIDGALATARYSSTVELTVRSERLPRQRAWNVAHYRRGADREWRIIFFQVTEMR